MLVVRVNVFSMSHLHSSVVGHLFLEVFSTSICNSLSVEKLVFSVVNVVGQIVAVEAIPFYLFLETVLQPVRNPYRLSFLVFFHVLHKEIWIVCEVVTALDHFAQARNVLEVIFVGQETVLFCLLVEGFSIVCDMAVVIDFDFVVLEYL